MSLRRDGRKMYGVELSTQTLTKPNTSSAAPKTSSASAQRSLQRSHRWTKDQRCYLQAQFNADANPTDEKFVEMAAHVNSTVYQVTQYYSNKPSTERRKMRGSASEVC